ncbi:uncharacterized protein LOC125838137 [Solanum verrucosum]|uniref:Putative proteasome assembly chaperone 4-like n=1 Tax=Solanum chacoense TaxID=4108 RepID=A0A0V0HFA4_SOLCH|nr:uncharacterized protein LOC125838137 [Solanum verrucosum]XP_049411030.1 uncharacterized protein LOC125874231 [Solanum stenotomum]KAH0658507.1 hypothetical protein KY289_027255 [Solanum tuberosum]
MEESPPSSSSNGRVDVVTETMNQLKVAEEGDDGSRVQVTCFSEVVNDATLYFQIIRLQNQIYAWIGCNSTKLGDLYAAAPTRPGNTVSVSSLTGGSSDNTGAGIARRIVLKTGINVVLASNIPKNSPMLEAAAEKKLVQKLISLGYGKPGPRGRSS